MPIVPMNSIKKRKKDPQEIQQEQAGKEFIMAREKRASQLSQGGNVGQRTAQEIATREIGQGIQPQVQNNIVKQPGLAPQVEPINLNVQQAQEFEKQFQAQEQGLQPLSDQAPEIRPDQLPPQSELSTSDKLRAIRAQPGVNGLTKSVQQFRTGFTDVAAPVVTALVNVRKAITGGKPLEVSNAEQIFGDLTTGLKEEIDGVRSGGNPYAVQTRIQQANTAIARLEAFQKKNSIGKLNLDYMSTKGAEVDAQIIAMKSVLGSMQEDFDRARIEGEAVRRAQFAQQFLAQQPQPQ